MSFNPYLDIYMGYYDPEDTQYTRSLYPNIYNRQSDMVDQAYRIAGENIRRTIQASGESPESVYNRNAAYELLKATGQLTDDQAYAMARSVAPVATDITTDRRNVGESWMAAYKRSYWMEKTGKSFGNYIMTGDPYWKDKADESYRKAQSYADWSQHNALGDMFIASAQPVESMVSFLIPQGAAAAGKAASTALLGPLAAPVNTAIDVSTALYNWWSAGNSQLGLDAYEMSMMTDSEGNHLDMSSPAAKALYVFWAGVDGFIEFKAMDLMPGYRNITRFLDRATTHSVISQTTRQFLQRKGVEYLEGIAGESGEEALQSLCTDYFYNLLVAYNKKKGISNFDYRGQRERVENAGNAAGSAAYGMVVGGLLTGVAGSVVEQIDNHRSAGKFFNTDASATNAETMKNPDTNTRVVGINAISGTRRFFVGNKEAEEKIRKKVQEIKDGKKMEPVHLVAVGTNAMPRSEEDAVTIEAVRRSKGRAVAAVQDDYSSGDVSTTKAWTQGMAWAFKNDGVVGYGTDQNGRTYMVVKDKESAAKVAKGIKEMDEFGVPVGSAHENEDGSWTLTVALNDNTNQVKWTEVEVTSDQSKVTNFSAPGEDVAEREEALRWGRLEKSDDFFTSRDRGVMLLKIKDFRNKVIQKAKERGQEMKPSIATATAEAYIAGAQALSMSTDDFMAQVDIRMADDEDITEAVKSVESSDGTQAKASEISGWHTADRLSKQDIIYLTRRATAATLFHETGHVVRRIMGTQNPMLNHDFETVYGVKDGTWTREAEERFADDFVRYVRNHTAPTEALGVLFEQIKNLLRTFISSSDREAEYRSPLSDEVREVFDKLFNQSDAAAEEARQQLGGSPQTVDTQMEVMKDDAPFGDEVDQATADWLDKQKLIPVVRTMQLRDDGTVGPPVAATIGADGVYKGAKPKGRISTMAQRLGHWVKSAENPDLIPEEVRKAVDEGRQDYGYVLLGNGDGGKLDHVAYAPYFHTIANVTDAEGEYYDVLYDQFKSAYKRNGLVLVAGYIPASELTSGYKAKYAKDHVGAIPWNEGPVSKALKQRGAQSRQVYLSRYFKPTRILTNEEVAQLYKRRLGDTGISVPINVVSPGLLKALQDISVPIGPPQGLKANEIRQLYGEDQIAKAKSWKVDNTILFERQNVMKEPEQFLESHGVPKNAKALGVSGIYAQLIGRGIKHVETRGMSTNYRGPVLIYQTLNTPKEWAGPSAKLADKYNLNEGAYRGYAVAVADLVDVKPMEEAPNAEEKAMGVYGPGRYGWVFENARMLDKPFKTNGLQSLQNATAVVAEDQNDNKALLNGNEANEKYEDVTNDILTLNGTDGSSVLNVEGATAEEVEAQNQKETGGRDPAITVRVKDKDDNPGDPIGERAGLGFWSYNANWLERNGRKLSNATRKALVKFFGGMANIQSGADGKFPSFTPFDHRRFATVEEYEQGQIRWMADNVKFIWGLASPNVRRTAILWYYRAHQLALDLVEADPDITVEQASAVIANFSPQTAWDLNVMEAVHLADFVRNMRTQGGNVTVDAAMIEKFDALLADKNKSEKLKALTRLISHEDVSFNSIFDPKRFTTYRIGEEEKKITTDDRYVMAALFFSAFDRSHNSNEMYNIDGLDGAIGTYSDRTTAAGQARNTSYAMFRSYDAIGDNIRLLMPTEDDIMEDGDGRRRIKLELISSIVGKQAKVRSFYDNIVQPWSSSVPKTMDTHAVGVAHGTSVSGSSDMVANAFGGHKVGDRGFVGYSGIEASAYDLAAGELNVLPNELQAVTWVVIRWLFTPDSKASKSVGKERGYAASESDDFFRIHDIWDKHMGEGGDKNLAAARDEVFAGVTSEAIEQKAAVMAGTLDPVGTRSTYYTNDYAGITYDVSRINNGRTADQNRKAVVDLFRLGAPVRQQFHEAVESMKQGDVSLMDSMIHFETMKEATDTLLQTATAAMQDEDPNYGPKGLARMLQSTFFAGKDRKAVVGEPLVTDSAYLPGGVPVETTEDGRYVVYRLMDQNKETGERSVVSDAGGRPVLAGPVPDVPFWVEAPKDGYNRVYVQGAIPADGTNGIEYLRTMSESDRKAMLWSMGYDESQAHLLYDIGDALVRMDDMDEGERDRVTNNLLNRAKGYGQTVPAGSDPSFFINDETPVTLFELQKDDVKAYEERWADAVREALKAGQYVPLRVLSQLPDKWWARREMKIAETLWSDPLLLKLARVSTEDEFAKVFTDGDMRYAGQLLSRLKDDSGEPYSKDIEADEAKVNDLYQKVKAARKEPMPGMSYANPSSYDSYWAHRMYQIANQKSPKEKDEEFAGKYFYTKDGILALKDLLTRHAEQSSDFYGGRAIKYVKNLDGDVSPALLKMTTRSKVEDIMAVMNDLRRNARKYRHLAEQEIAERERLQRWKEGRKSLDLPEAATEQDIGRWMHTSPAEEKEMADTSYGWDDLDADEQDAAVQAAENEGKPDIKEIDETKKTVPVDQAEEATSDVPDISVFSAQDAAKQIIIKEADSDQIKNLNRKMDRLLAKLGADPGEKVKGESAADAVNRKFNVLKKAVSEKRTLVRELKERLAHEKEQYKRAQGGHEVASDVLDIDEKDIDELFRKLWKASDRLENSEVRREATEDRLDEAQHTVKLQAKDLEKKGAEIERLTQDLAQTTNDLQEVDEALRDYRFIASRRINADQTKIANDTKQIERLRERLAKLGKDATKERHDLKGQIATLEARVADLEQKMWRSNEEDFKRDFLRGVSVQNRINRLKEHRDSKYRVYQQKINALNEEIRTLNQWVKAYAEWGQKMRKWMDRYNNLHTRMVVQSWHRRLRRTTKLGPSLDVSCEDVLALIRSVVTHETYDPDTLMLSDQSVFDSKMAEAVLRAYASRVPGGDEVAALILLPEPHGKKKFRYWTPIQLYTLSNMVDLIRKDASNRLAERQHNRMNRLNRTQEWFYQEATGMDAPGRKVDQSRSEYADELRNNANQAIPEFDEKSNVLTKSLVTWRNGFIKMQRLARIVDGYREGALYDFFVRQAWQANLDELHSEIRRWDAGTAEMKRLGITTDSLFKKMYTYRKGVTEKTLTVGECIGVYVYSQNPIGLQKLVGESGNGLTENDVNEIISRLTPEQKAWGDWMIADFAENREYVEDVFYRVYNQRLGHRDRYFTFVSEGNNGHDETELYEPGASLTIGPDKQAQMHVNRDSTKLINKDAVYALNLNVTTSWRSQVRREAHFVAWAEWSRDANYLLGNHAAITSIIRQKYGRNTAKQFQDYANDLAGSNSDIDALQQMFNIVLSNNAVGKLAFNLMTAIKQIPAGAAAIGQCDLGSWLTAGQQLSVHPKETMEMIFLKDPTMRVRYLEQDLQRVNESARHSRVQSAINKVDNEYGMTLSQITDRYAASHVWLAVYLTQRNHGASEQDAVFRASQLVAETQNTTQPTDLAEVQRRWNSPFERAVLMFTNQTFQTWNEIFADIPYFIRTRQYSRALGMATNLALNLGAMVFLSGVWRKRGSGDDEEARKRRLMLEVISELAQMGIPIFGQAISEGISGYGGGEVMGFGGAIGKYIYKLVNDKGLTIDDLRQWVNEVGTLAGGPSLAIDRAWKMGEKFADTGDLDLGFLFGQNWQNYDN